MDVEHLRAFVTVARSRRFTEAARQLGTSQPNVSRRVQQLERDVGARLVVRTPRGVVLTSAGEQFLAHAERALASIGAGITAIEELSGQPRGAVTIGSQRTIGAYALPDVLARFRARHPEVVLRLHEGMPDVMEERLAAGELDLAILNLPVRRLELAVQRLWQEDYLLAVPANHRLAGLDHSAPRRDRSVDLADAAAESLLVVPGAASTAALLAACEERGVPARVVLEADNLEAVRRMVERGVGVALLPRIMARAIDSKRVRVLEIRRGGPRRQVALVHRGVAYLTAAARAFRATLLEVYGKTRAPSKARRGS